MKNKVSLSITMSLLLFQFCFVTGKSQSKEFGIVLSNNITSLPVTTYSKLFYSQFHPGMEGYLSKKLNQSEKNHIIVKGNLGFYYHRFIQTSIWIYPSINYERSVTKRFLIGAGLGFGYAYSIEDGDVFILNDDSIYEKKSVISGRSQFIGQLELGGSYSLIKERTYGLKLHISLKSYLQGIYVKNYVPIIPINSLLIGLSIPLKSK
ncbi:MAG: hypothetical protein ABIJ97_04970 [Bacteroidota bacterium]